ncbi:unnamed protein product [Pleuronectes platessa]|uniref:Uncharacterized protein n=1 Tax=Pleuronectes platessa TaxID=8262 RepID=A0A9N7Y546_PLEPL|nr:unnamed protein product [Pleuronectes platessa]
MRHTAVRDTRLSAGREKEDVTLQYDFKNLQCCPVPQRIQYKVLFLTHKALHNQAPSYLTDLLQAIPSTQHQH